MKHKLLYILLIFTIFFSCKKDKETIYYNFTNDDLSFILLKDSSIGQQPLSYYIRYQRKYLLNDTDTINSNININLYQQKYDAANKYMIRGRLELNYILLGYYNTIYIDLIKNDSFYKDNLYKSISVNYIDTTDNDFQNCENKITKCFDTEFCDNSKDYVIDTVEYKGVNYQSYIFNFSDENIQVKQITFIKNIGFVYIVDIYDNKLEFLEMYK